MSMIHASQLDTSPPEWLAEGMIPRTGWGILHGPSGTGKSLVTNGELALAVANGTPFFGRETVHGSVVLCLGEGLYDAGVRMQARLARQAAENAAAVELTRHEHGDEFAEQFAASLPPYTANKVFVVTEPFTVPVTRGAATGNEPSFEQALAGLKRIGDLELVILDALADFTGGLSVSNDTSANRFVLGVKRLVRELDCVVLAVAHDTKDGQRMLGAQRFYNSADFVIHAIPETGQQPEDPPAGTLTCAKSKYSDRFAPVGYQLEPAEWDTPVLDDEGSETGETVTVTSATVRIRAVSDPGAEPGEIPLPQLRQSVRRRKRNGIRRLAAI